MSLGSGFLNIEVRSTLNPLNVEEECKPLHQPLSRHVGPVVRWPSRGRSTSGAVCVRFV